MQATFEFPESMFVQSIERWRVAMGLDKIVLIGHSFGAFVSSFAIFLSPPLFVNLHDVSSLYLVLRRFYSDWASMRP